MDDSSPTVIVDVGAHGIRFGTSASETPTLICSPCMSKKLYTIKDNSLIEDVPWYENAVERGIIKNWSIIEDLLQHFIDGNNNIEPSKSSLIFTLSLAATEKDKEKAMDILFEKFNFESICFTSDAHLSFVATGKSTGCVVQLGHSITQFLPILDDKPLLDKAAWFDVSGIDISNQLIPEVEIPYDLDRKSPFARQKFDAFKEANCFVALDHESELKRFESDDSPPESPGYLKYLKDSPIARKFQHFRKPTSQSCFDAPEILFQPSLLGKTKSYGIVEQLYETISSVKPMGYHGLLYSNIILSGGTAKLRGLKERFALNIDGYSPKLSKVHVSLATDTSPPHQKPDDDEEGYASTSTHDKSTSDLSLNSGTDSSLAAFKGGTMLANRPDFSSLLIEREDRIQFRRSRSRASNRSFRSSYRASSSTFLTPDIVEF